MHIRISQAPLVEWAEYHFTPRPIDDTLKHAGNLQPFLVQNQWEKDYLDGLFLLMGKQIVVLLDGIDENTTGVPPTYAELVEL